MKARNITLISILVLAVLLTVGHESNGKVKSSSITPKVGFVRIRTAFMGCNRNAEHQKKLSDEQKKILTELEKLSKEAEALNADLMTRKPGSSDYSRLTLEIMDKKAQLNARREFYQQQLMLKDQQWTEQLYKEILEAAEKVAKANGLDMVLAKEEIDFPTETQTELMLAIRTNSLLYSSNDFDITKEVLKQLNSKK
jgi:Skp family chaperone for outer membrane proteins